MHCCCIVSCVLINETGLGGHILHFLSKKKKSNTFSYTRKESRLGDS